MNRGEQILASCWEAFQKKMCLESFYIKNRLKDYKPSEIHCIEYIGNNPNSNVTKLADAFRMTTGGITKLTKKLIEKNLIETYKSPDNKKEIYFRLTDYGKEIYKIHDNLDKEFQKRDKDIFNQITEEEYICIIHFFNMYSHHLDNELEKAGIDIKSGVLNKL